MLTSTLPPHFLNNNFQNNRVDDYENKENFQQQATNSQETFDSGEGNDDSEIEENDVEKEKENKTIKICMNCKILVLLCF